MAMRCPICGTENPEDARFCQTCAAVLPIVVSGQGPIVQGPPAKKMPKWTIVVIVVVMAAAVIGAVAAAMLASQKAHSFLGSNLSFTASYDNGGLGPGGNIEVFGWIQNFGDANSSGTVLIHLFDGSVWHDYYVPTEVVPAGGKAYFDWSAHFDSLDKNSVKVIAAVIN